MSVEIIRESFMNSLNLKQTLMIDFLETWHEINTLKCQSIMINWYYILQGTRSNDIIILKVPCAIHKILNILADCLMKKSSCSSFICHWTILCDRCENFDHGIYKN